MLRPIEFDSVRNPRPQQSHERWLDYILPIEKIVSVYFVLADGDFIADFRRNHKPNAVVFQINCLVRLVRIAFWRSGL